MFGVMRRVFLLILLKSAIGSAQVSEPKAVIPDSTTNDNIASSSSHHALQSATSDHAPSNATCTSRSINYITHTLPQQCLRTDRASFNSSSPSVASRILEPTSGNLDGTGHALENVAASLVSETNVTTTSRITAGSSSAAIEPTHASTTSISVETLTATALTAPVETPVAQSEIEAESPLDNANFLSFEEWKKQNLAKAGQSPENIGQERPRTGDRQRPGIDNALDTLGEENEIELDFSGFGGNTPVQSSQASKERPASTGTPEHGAAEQSSPGNNLLRSKDAGKTCKERTNYASFDCAATILKSNKECKSVPSVLVENKDSYMLNICSAENKFFIVELCNDILIDTIVLANYEFFSSIFRHFRVSVSDRYPVKMDKWRDLGTFEARNTREVQAFLIENPLIWARYLRIEFLTHYGNEYYCPVSLLRVHGKTMMQEFRQQEELARGELDEEPVEEAEATPAASVAQEPLTATDELERTTVQQIPSIETGSETTSTDYASADTGGSTWGSMPVNSSNVSIANSANASVDMLSNLTQHAWVEPTCAATSIAVSDPSVPTPDGTQLQPMPMDQNTTASSTDRRALTTSTAALKESSSNEKPVSKGAEDSASISNTTSVASSNVSTQTAASQTSASSSVSSPNSTTQTTSPTSKASSSVSGSANTSSNSTRAVVQATPAASSQPPTQESFFKSISKRLQQLESNSTLSLQYIEEQSRILRDAFNKVEKRQISATSNFLTHLNETVMSELNGFRQAYDQLWQSTVIELDGQREQYQREMLALSTRLTLVADELVWQKRMGIVQSTLLLLCLGMALFARQGNGNLELPLVQQMMHKSQAALRGWDSEPNSPSPARRSPVSLFRRKLWRSGAEAENADLTDGTDSRPRTGGGREGGLEVQIEPPTPIVDDAQSDMEDLDDEDEAGVQSSPATPNGTGEGLKRPLEWAHDDYNKSSSSLNSSS